MLTCRRWRYEGRGDSLVGSDKRECRGGGHLWSDHFLEWCHGVLWQRWTSYSHMYIIISDVVTPSITNIEDLRFWIIHINVTHDLEIKFKLQSLLQHANSPRSECCDGCECGGSQGPVATVTSVCIKLRSLDGAQRAGRSRSLAREEREDQSEPAISDYQCRAWASSATISHLNIATHRGLLLLMYDPKLLSWLGESDLKEIKCSFHSLFAFS